MNIDELTSAEQETVAERRHRKIESNANHILALIYAVEIGIFVGEVNGREAVFGFEETVVFFAVPISPIHISTFVNTVNFGGRGTREVQRGKLVLYRGRGARGYRTVPEQCSDCDNAQR
jgi:hypothetical protein